jgi:hypothetical protein
MYFCVIHRITGETRTIECPVKKISHQSNATELDLVQETLKGSTVELYLDFINSDTKTTYHLYHDAAFYRITFLNGRNDVCTKYSKSKIHVLSHQAKEVIAGIQPETRNLIECGLPLQTAMKLYPINHKFPLALVSTEESWCDPMLKQFEQTNELVIPSRYDVSKLFVKEGVAVSCDLNNFSHIRILATILGLPICFCPDDYMVIPLDKSFLKLKSHYVIISNDLINKCFAYP